FNPGIHISTSDAYSEVNPEQSGGSWMKSLQSPPEKWGKDVMNDFEESVFLHHPELAMIKSELYDRGAVYAAMSGSGSTIYGIFRDEVQFHSSVEKYKIWQEKISGRE
ncbi:MAG: 4-(cytidine 5'-diphospho)-2-C-methyl-D-erythritol kinase, partial [Bacteroidales bacterium]|nr:4-(cytidine 5'-diphospho)-2-C-methyl-D-erythritol kinase [Bacteroidales bacterium]